MNILHDSVHQELVLRLGERADADVVASKLRFFQAGPGGYAEGDQFIGVTVPDVRSVARDARREGPIGLATIDELLQHPIHEVRLLGCVLLVDEFKPKRTLVERKRALVDLLLARVEYLNNWDLIDTVAAHSLGTWLRDQPRDAHIAQLDELATSDNIWRRRLAMVSTQASIKAGDNTPALHVAELLINDNEDLIHKAVGWMLREVGIKNRVELNTFLDRHAATMPRTALRYALEKHAPDERRHYMGLAKAARATS